MTMENDGQAIAGVHGWARAEREHHAACPSHAVATRRWHIQGVAAVDRVASKQIIVWNFALRAERESDDGALGIDQSCETPGVLACRLGTARQSLAMPRCIVGRISQGAVEEAAAVNSHHENRQSRDFRRGD